MAKPREEYTLKDVAGKEKIDSLKEITADVTNISLASLLLYVLGAMEVKGITLSFPNLAVAAWKVFPKIFFLFGHDMPDSKRVSTTLWHLTNDKRGIKYRRLTGTIGGYVFTERGRQELVIATRSLKQPPQRKLATRRRKPDKQINEVRKTQAFLNFQQGDEITEFDVYRVLQCTLDSDIKMLQENFGTLYVLAEQAIADDVTKFLDALKNNFKFLRVSKNNVKELK